MKKSAASGLLLFLVMVNVFVLAFNVQLGSSEPTTWIVDDDAPADFHTIREAVNAANDGDTILVFEGYYAEGQINITKSGLNLTAMGNVTIDGLHQGHVLNITADNMNMKGFRIQNSLRQELYCGIELQGDNNTIINNTVTKNYCAIHLFNSHHNIIKSNNIIDHPEFGIVLSHSANNTITENKLVADGWHAMYIYKSGNNTISYNNLTDHVFIGIDIVRSSNNLVISNRVTDSGAGMALDSAPNNILRNNTIINNNCNFALVTDLLELPLAFNDVDRSNTVNGKPICYWTNKHSATVPLDAGFVALVNCSNIKVANLTLEKNLHGITLFYTRNTEVTRNNVTANYRRGIFSSHSPDCTISRNNVTDNERGIHVVVSSRTIVVQNTIMCKERYHPGNGISIGYSSDCNITLNNVVGNWYGIQLLMVSATTVCFNNVVSNGAVGISLGRSSGNTIFNNNFVDNVQQVGLTPGYVNVWDDGYPGGGNFWSDYDGVDVYGGVDQDVFGGDGLGDSVRVVDGVNFDRYPLISPWPSHDVAAVNVTMWDVVGPGLLLPINVTVSNQGDFAEVFNVTLTIDEVLVGVQTVSSGRAVMVLTFFWNMSGMRAGTYSMHACAWVTVVPGEVDLYDNGFVGGLIEVIPDLDGDGRVDIQDILLAVMAYGCSEGDHNWNPYADMAPPYGRIDIFDLVTCAYHYGRIW